MYNGVCGTGNAGFLTTEPNCLPTQAARVTSNVSTCEPQLNMDDSSKKSKASFFDRLYSIHDGYLDVDESEGASISLSLGGGTRTSNRETIGGNMRHNSNPTDTLVEATSPQNPHPTAGGGESASSEAVPPPAYHRQNLPDSLRFKFADRKTLGRSCKKSVRESPAPKSTLFMGMYFCNNRTRSFIHSSIHPLI